MKKHLIAATIGLAAAAGAYAAGNTDDPVLMTVDGRDIHVSEFEYLFNKNNSQQQQPQSIDEYLKMFIDYKLKVADAEHAGLAQTPEFESEYAGFRADLAAPYMRDNALEDSLVAEAYSHYLDDVLVSHIMVQPMQGEAMLDSIRTAILDGRTTFEEQAVAISVDRGSSMRGGLMGYVTPGRFPYAFEKAAYDTPEGAISPVVNSGMGYHIIRVEHRQPATGQVSASHILRMTRGKSDTEIAAQRAMIDSLYAVVKANPDSFAEVARQYSEDPGSAQRGGDLGFFGRGAMVAEFDSVSFVLPDGAISTPFETAFGYHIVKRTGHKDVESIDAARPAILEAMKRDERGQMPESMFLSKLMKNYGATLIDEAFVRVAETIRENGGYDSTVIVAMTADPLPVGTYNGGTLTLAEVMPHVAQTKALDADNATALIRRAAEARLQGKVLDAERSKMEATTPEYRNLLNEYRDGILLYEIANRNVWDKASKDKAGLEKFFKKNIAKYRWSEPKFKSFIFFAASDSILDKAVAYADSLSTANPTEFTQAMRTKFGKEVKIERVIAAKGENAITDYLAFGGDKPSADRQTKWTAYRAYKGRIIDTPEEASDVRGAAVTDYQAQLEKDWVKKLHKRYKVNLNKQEFERLKQHK